MCNLYSMTRNVDAIRRLFKVEAANDRIGHLPPLPRIYPDYPAPIVRNGGERRELAMARWGMPSSPRATQSTSKNYCEWSPIAAPIASAT
jgi:putative SOS response-associated peptidase YedK